MRTRIVVFAVSAALAFFPAAAIAQTSQQYALMGREFYVAFTCSDLALMANDAKEHKRLFMIGYEQGKLFIGAVRDGNIEDKDLRREVPVPVMLMLQGGGGPSIDFVLGEMYNNAVTASDVMRIYYIKDESVREAAAHNKYDDMNCRLIN